MMPKVSCRVSVMSCPIVFCFILKVFSPSVAVHLSFLLFSHLSVHSRLDCFHLCPPPSASPFVLCQIVVFWTVDSSDPTSRLYHCIYLFFILFMPVWFCSMLNMGFSVVLFLQELLVNFGCILSKDTLIIIYPVHKSCWIFQACLWLWFILVFCHFPLQSGFQLILYNAEYCSTAAFGSSHPSLSKSGRTYYWRWRRSVTQDKSESSLISRNVCSLLSI